MEKVRDILNTERLSLHYVSPDDSVARAIQVLAQVDLGAILVKQDERVVGIISERDYARKVAALKKSDETPVSEVMSSPVFYVSPNETMEDCLALMNMKQVRHLPVVDEGQVVGLISILDVVQALLFKKDTVIDHLEKYVSEVWPF